MQPAYQANGDTLAQAAAYAPSRKAATYTAQYSTGGKACWCGSIAERKEYISTLERAESTARVFAAKDAKIDNLVHSEALGYLFAEFTLKRSEGLRTSLAIFAAGKTWPTF